MTNRKPFCFVIMPFIPHLNFFYLYFKRHIEETHNIQCERADSKILTVPFLDKVVDYIKKADVLLADCSGRNANVFYELGMGHALGKKVILITGDDLKDAPADVRHFDFIKYDLSEANDFLNKLDNALHNVFFWRYKALYYMASDILDKFRHETGAQISAASKELFIQRVSVAERTTSIPDCDDRLRVIEFVLPKIIADSSDIRVMNTINEWVKQSTGNENCPTNALQRTSR